jgi:hypothetical protein
MRFFVRFIGTFFLCVFDVELTSPFFTGGAAFLSRPPPAFLARVATLPWRMGLPLSSSSTSPVYASHTIPNQNNENKPI